MKKKPKAKQPDPGDLSFAEVKAYLEQCPHQLFVYLVKLAMWAADGCEGFNMDLAYQDDEVMLFRRKTPLSKVAAQAREAKT